MKKVTPQQLLEMKEMRTQGIQVKDIAIKLGISKSAVEYHIYSDKKSNRIKRQIEYFRNLPKEKKEAIYKKRSGYLNQRYKNKYHSDPAFRAKEIIRCNSYKKKEKSQGIAIIPEGN